MLPMLIFILAEERKQKLHFLSVAELTFSFWSEGVVFERERESSESESLCKQTLSLSLFSHTLAAFRDPGGLFRLQVSHSVQLQLVPLPPVCLYIVAINYCRHRRSPWAAITAPVETRVFSVYIRCAADSLPQNGLAVRRGESANRSSHIPHEMMFFSFLYKVCKVQTEKHPRTWLVRTGPLVSVLNCATIGQVLTSSVRSLIAYKLFIFACRLPLAVYL